MEIVDRVASSLKNVGFEVERKRFDVSTRSSVLAAQALGCTVAEIAKNVVFSGGGTHVIILSGEMKVDTGKLSRLVGSEVELVAPDTVRRSTGYPIGGVPPFPNRSGVRTAPDHSLERFKQVWTAGGAPDVVFRVKTDNLLRTIGAGPL